MSYLQKIQQCHTVQLADYLPFWVADEPYGYIRHRFAAQLQQWDDIFHIDADQVRLNPQLTDYQQRSDVLAPVLAELHQTGLIDTWVDELYPVNHRYGEQGVLEMERAAALYFGIRCYGVHMNGLVKKPEGIYVWIAIRAKDKPFFPGKRDQIVAGGQPVGISLMDNLIKECQEEANIPAQLASQAQARGYLHYQMETRRGMEVGTLFNYDCWLPSDFMPENTDGEVDSFELVPMETLAHLTEHSDTFKDNCYLSNIDLLIRSGFITEKHKDYHAITRLLYSGI